jgi:hypothetical protein
VGCGKMRRSKQLSQAPAHRQQTASNQQRTANSRIKMRSAGRLARECRAICRFQIHAQLRVRAGHGGISNRSQEAGTGSERGAENEREAGRWHCLLTSNRPSSESSVTSARHAPLGAPAPRPIWAFWVLRPTDRLLKSLLELPDDCSFAEETTSETLETLEVSWLSGRSIWRRFSHCTNVVLLRGQ